MKWNRKFNVTFNSVKILSEMAVKNPTFSMVLLIINGHSKFYVNDFSILQHIEENSNSYLTYHLDIGNWASLLVAVYLFKKQNINAFIWVCKKEDK